MNPIATQQATIDNALVPPEKRLKIERCNSRITVEVLKIYMHQFFTTIKKIKNSYAYKFKLEKKKFRVDTEFFREILQICPRILNQDFIAPPSEVELVTFIQELGYSGKCNMLSAIHIDQMHQPWRTFATVINKDFMYQADNIEISLAREEHMLYSRFTKVIINHFILRTRQSYGALILDDMINQDIKYSKAYKTYYDFATGKVPPRKARKYKNVASPLRKLSPIKEAKPVKKAKRVKRLAKKYATATTVGAIIRDTLGVSVSKKKAPAKGDGVGSQPKVLDEFKDKTTGIDEGTGRGSRLKKDDDGSNAHDSERTDSCDDDEHPSFTLKDYDEEEHDEEYESDDDNKNVFEKEDDDLYKDVNVRSLGAKHEKERKGDEEMTDTDQNKTESSKQSSSVSSDSTSKFLIMDNIPPVVDEVASIMNLKNRQEESSTQAPFLFILTEMAISKISTTHATTIPPISTINESLETVFLEKSPSGPKSKYEAAKSLTESELKKILLDKIERSKSYKTTPEHKELYEGLVKSYNLDKDLCSSYVKAYSLKREREDKDKDEDPFAGSDRRHLVSAESSGKSVQAEEPVFERPAFNLLKGTCKSFVELEYHFKECYKDVTGQLDWNNPEGHEYPFDLSKPLPMIEAQGRQVVHVDYFFNNDLEYLKGRSSSKKYITSTTKTKAAKYNNIEGIKDMVFTLWSPVKVAYDKFAMWGISHWGPKRQKFYGTQATGSPSMTCSLEKESLQ
uniref:Uncharacterized protein n=1 Tax=Tanacetum cinerariifolium TaxID=118510 RepID=A0A6L2N488_TANCI|nr:hypothetical protein [Tanacetum cinerariifolium]